MSLLFDENGNVPWNMPKPLVNAERGAVAYVPDVATRAGKMTAILAKLNESPGEWVNSKDLIPITHRFSASILNLRERGHRIINRRCDDESFEWLYEGYEPRAAVKEDEQSAYYHSPHWRAKRQERLAFDNYRCCQCHSTTDLHVHHWRYDLFAERLEDLTTLCKVCHAKVHDELPIHFPRFVSWSIKEKLIVKEELP